MNKQYKSDVKFLNRLVFITSGEMVGVTTLRDLIEKNGTYSFRANFIEGRYRYSCLTYWGWMYDEKKYDPVVIEDARSGKQVCARGALTLYLRVYDGRGYDKNHWQSGFNGFKPSRYRRCRKIKTFSTTRASCIHFEEEGEFEHKPKVKKLPSARDGILDTSKRDKSWKNFRKTQYKIKTR